MADFKSAPKFLIDRLEKPIKEYEKKHKLTEEQIADKKKKTEQWVTFIANEMKIKRK